MKAGLKKTIFPLLLTLSSSSVTTVAAEFPLLSERQTILEWNAQSDQVGSHHVIESRLAFEEFARAHLKAPSENRVKIPDTATLEDFESHLKTALSRSQEDAPEVLRVFVNSHGSTDSFQSQLPDSAIFWDDFVKSVAEALQNANGRPKVLELYLSPCYSGSIIPSLEKRLQKAQAGGVEINVWTGSSGFTTTSSPEFPEAIKAFANLNFTLEKYLDRTAACSTGDPAASTADEVDLIGSLGGMSFSEFWTNSGKRFRKLSERELERLLASGDPFLEERALTSLLQRGLGSADSAGLAAGILKNPAKGYYVRTLAAKYLGRIPRNNIAAQALLETAKDPQTKNSAFKIREAAIEALGYADAGASPRLIEMFHDPEFGDFKGSILLSIGATKDPKGLGLIKSHLDSKDLLLRQGAQGGLFRGSPEEAIRYFDAKLKNPETDSQQRYSIRAALNEKMAPELAPLAVKLLVAEWERATGQQKLYVLQQIGSLAKEQAVTREALKKEFFPKVRKYADASLARGMDLRSPEAALAHASRLLQFLLEE